MIARKSLQFFFALLSLNYLAASESDAPVISEPSITPSEVDVSESDKTVTLSIRVQDETGIYSYTNPSLAQDGSPATLISAPNWSLASGDLKDGIWESTVTIPTTTPTSDWYIFTGYFRDTWGNTTLQSFQSMDMLSVVNRYSESDAPVISEPSITPSEVDVSESDKTVTLSIRVQDETGIYSYTNPSLAQDGSPATLISAPNWSLASGDLKDGIWESTVTIPTTTPTSDWYIFTGYFRDTWGNTTLQSFQSMDMLGVVNNHPPKIRSSSFNVNENTTRIGKLKVNDKDDDNLTYAVSGASSITINSSTGLLTFKKRPNYEQKSQYTFRAYVNDGQVTVSKKITINILDVNEPPSLTKKQFSINQGETRKVILQATDPESDSVTYQLSPGGDAAYFRLNQLSGALSFIDTPSFSDNTTLNLSILLNDGDLETTENIKVNVSTKYLKQIGNTMYSDYWTGDRFIVNYGASFFINNKPNTFFGTFDDLSDYSFEIREYEKQNNIWENINTIGRNNSFTGRQLIILDTNANHNKFIASVKNCPDNDDSCSSSEIGNLNYEQWTYQFNQITQKWARSSQKLPIRSERSPLNMSADGKFLAIQKEFPEYGYVDSNSPSCGKIEITRYRSKNDEWKKFKKKKIIRNSRLWYEQVRFSESGDKLMTFNRYQCDPNDSNDQPYDKWPRSNKIKVFEYSLDENNWVRLGNTIDIEKLILDKDTDSDYRPYFWTRINSDLTKIAVSMYPEYSIDRDENGYFNTSIVRTYFFHYDSGKNKWIRQRQYFDNNHDFFAISDDFKTMILSREPTFYATGGRTINSDPLLLEIYKFDDGTNRWKKFITEREYGLECYNALKLKLSPNGSILSLNGGCPWDEYTDEDLSSSTESMHKIYKIMDNRSPE